MAGVTADGRRPGVPTVTERKVIRVPLYLDPLELAVAEGEIHRQICMNRDGDPFLRELMHEKVCDALRVAGAAAAAGQCTEHRVRECAVCLR